MTTTRALELVHKLILTTEDCPNCGAVFAMTNEFIANRRRTHNSFYCPAGHPMSYSDKTDADRLREKEAELERARDHTAQVREQLARERASHSATKGRLTKTLNRVNNGVCPHCNRTFVNVQKHMASKHAAQDPEPKGQRV